MSALRESDKFIILYSGGLDSTTALYKFANQIELAISFNYGSKHNEQEIKHALMNCKKLNIKHQIIDFDFNKLGFVSDLLKSGSYIPIGHYEDQSMKKTVIPFRNGIMLSIVTGIAESLNYNKIVISNHSGDHAIYPDCRQSFIDSMNNAIKFGTYNEIEIFAPFTNITTGQIADDIMNFLDAQGCIVICKAQHLCITSRGVEKQKTEMITSALRGIFFNNDITRSEFLQLIK